jgi:hypothetical protein
MVDQQNNMKPRTPKNEWMRRTVMSVFILGLTMMAATAAARYQGARSWAFKSIRPTSGPWGTVVTLRGYGFSKSIEVYYNGKKLKKLSVSSSYIKAKVPQGASSGWFAVKHKGRSLRAPTRFKVINPPKVEKLVPAAGPPNNWVLVEGRFLEKGMRFWIGRTPVKRRFVSAQKVRLFIHRGVRSGRLFYRWKGKKTRTRLRFKVSPYPSIAGFSPRRAWHGDVVAIKGRNICSNATVLLDGDKLPIVGSVKPQVVRVRISKGADSGVLVVQCFGRKFKTRRKLQIKPPYGKVSAVAPKGGPAGGWVVIKGKGFERKDRFWIGRTPIRQVKYISANRVRARIPANARSGVIHYQSFGKRFSTTVRFTVYRKPVIAKVAPLRGWYGEEITLKGRNFCPNMTVTLRGRKLPVLKRKGSRAVVVRIVRGVRAGRLAVSCLRWKVKAPKPFRLVPPKANIKRVRPLSGPPGTKITVTGSGFRRNDIFYLGSKRMNMTYKGPTRVVLTVPKGSRSAKIVHKSFGRKKTTKYVFKVAWPRPIVASYRPRKAWYGDTVTLTGRRICPQPKVMLKGKKLKVLSSDGSKIKVRLPAKIKSGNFIVKCARHRVVVRPAITIKPPYAQVFSIYPKSGPPGTWVTINGEDLSRSDKFYLRGKPLKTRYVGSHQIKVRIPQGAKTGKLMMRSGGHKVKLKGRFTVAFPTPVVKDFSPRSGWYGQTVTIKGQRFCLDPKVLFSKNKEAKVEKRLGPNTLRVKVPAKAETGTVKVVCYGRTGSSSRYFVLSPPLAHVSGVSPDRGGWNRWITIRGRNFTRKTKFYLGRTRLKMQFKSKNKVKVFIPPGAKSGLIYVESYGRKKDSSFTYAVRRKKKGKKKRPRRSR